MRIQNIIALVFLTLIILPAITPGAQAIEYTRTCFNDTHLLKEANINISGEVDDYSQLLYCPNGCDSDALRCIDPYNPSDKEVYMSLLLYGVLFIIAFASLLVGYFKQTLLLTIFSTLIFFVLAFQSFSFDMILVDTSFSSLTLVFVMFCWFMAILAFIITLIGMIEALKERKNGENPYYGGMSV